MTAVAYKFTTTASTNLLQVRQQGSIKGFSATNASTTVMLFIKLYWFIPTLANPTPVVGTTIPSYVIPVNPGAVVGAGSFESWPDGITGNGQLWVAATAGTGADTDTTVATAGCVISLNVE
jgi:hypothetical protein